MTLAYNTYDYWFNNPEILPCGGDQYKSAIVFEGLVKTLDIPSEGWCVQLGTYTGYTLQLMKQWFGTHRVCGIDKFNPTNDPSVLIQDINEIQFNLPIAYAENDVGTMYEAPQDRLVAFKWAISNLVPGGVLITTSNVANAAFGESVESICSAHRCTWTRLDVYDNQPWAQQLNKETVWNTISMMLVRKIT
jgi:hypothetical protein